MKTTESNRRAFPRVENEIPVEIIRAVSKDSRPIRGTLQDLSQVGVMIITTEVIPAGEWITLRPDRKGAGYGTEVTAEVEQNTAPNEPVNKYVCRFPTPLDYATLGLFR